ncbi:methyltransferase domain-containing protein [Paenibacillus rhizovicinus]|uniref:Small RNA 2'-O-methyltransferase n=1 Tax=Paenibacillus rhizovicinus TaxID=2704463 RepID=A0A6C0NZZ4_9BACL|nr:methyltransferase domain-containing protein [Paenibacillus rhizovicinus]QHW31840.1 methyltransferase domain-containing protein [Paenibacillus rhizovicinus]
MAIVQVRSANPHFTFLIKKNPGTGMQLRPIRKGMAYGWYSDETATAFNVYFKDAANDISYKRHEDESFEYLNVSRYNTPLFPLNAINDFFSAPFKARDDRDTGGFEHSFFINLIHVDRVRYIAFFEKHMRECAFTLEHRAHKSYSLTITTQKSLYHLLHVVSVLCLFLSLFGDEYIDISDAILDKYIRSLNVIDAPFYIRSLFARNFLSTRERFKKYKADIERTDRYAIALQYGGTALQRRNHIAGVLPFDKSILDIGCGEGFYALPFAGKIDSSSYYAVDLNEEVLETVRRKAEARDIGNIATFLSAEQFLESYNGERVDVILTEVIEHMPEQEAAALIRRICDTVDFDRMIVTTPNADFNRYYELDDFRHDDHKWEMGEEAFRSWFAETVREVPASVEFIAIGDSVNGTYTTQGVIVRGKEAT